MSDDRRKRIAEARRAHPITELERKAAKAKTPGFWTQEDLDLADAKAGVLARYFEEIGK